MALKKVKTPAWRHSYSHSKYALFNAYVSTLSLSSYPSALGNNRLSRLSGLTTKRGRRRLNTQKWVWLIGPLWSSWSSWFDTLVGSFSARGTCVAYGPASLELVSSAFTWLTLGKTHSARNFLFAPLSALREGGAPNAFYILLCAPRYLNLENRPIFALSGSNVRSRTGWASLPGPTSNKALQFFLLTAALAAYRLSKGRAL